MNPVVLQWKALPLWLKLVLLPFVISGALTVLYITVTAIAGLFVGMAALVDHVRKPFRKVLEGKAA